jgi:leucyl-tRNA synthetase
LIVAVGIDGDSLKAAALASERVAEQLAGKDIKNIIVVPKRLVNIVVK